jgi:response regulator of citrate/malate metabolism
MARAAQLNNLQQWLKIAEKSTYSARVLSKKLEVSPRQLRRYTHARFGRRQHEKFSPSPVSCARMADYERRK